MSIVTDVPFGTLTTRVPLLVVKSSVPTLTSMVALPSVTGAGTGGPLVGVGSSSTAVVVGPVVSELDFELDPQAAKPRTRHSARGQAAFRAVVRPVTDRMLSLLSSGGCAWRRYRPGRSGEGSRRGSVSGPARCRHRPR